MERSNNYADYLGDGVYASFDGFNLLIHVGAHTNEPVVTLEPQVMQSLIKYKDNLNAKLKEDGLTDHNHFD